MEFLQCVSLSEARAIITAKLTGRPWPAEKVPLLVALGRVAAADIAAGEDLPAFSRSTVDGFAVRSADTYGASEAAPALFTLAGEILMGRAAPVGLAPGQAVLIHTGGMLPPGADAVAMLEHSEQLDDKTLLINGAVAPGENVVHRGEDIAAGSPVLTAGQMITARRIGLLAACGVSRVLVAKRPRVAVLSSGDEIVEIEETPAAGQVRDINSYTLAAMLTEAGCQADRLGIVRDRFEDFLAVLSQAVADYDLILLSGGSSVGARDHAVRAIGELGSPGVLIHGIAMKPGRPTIFGLAGRLPVFGLPGHPVAAITVCEELVKPAIRAMLGQPPAGRRLPVAAGLARNLASLPGRDDFVSVRLGRRPEGYVAEPILGKSGLITAIAHADGTLHLPYDKSGLYAGDQVEVLLFEDHK